MVLLNRFGSNDGPLSTLTANLSLVSFVLISKCQLWNRRKYSRWPLLFRGRACSSSSCGSNGRAGLLSSFVKSRNRHFNVDNFLPINGSFRRNNWSCLTYLSIFLSSSSKRFLIRKLFEILNIKITGNKCLVSADQKIKVFNASKLVKRTSFQRRRLLIELMRKENGYFVKVKVSVSKWKTTL